MEEFPLSPIGKVSKKDLVVTVADNVTAEGSATRP